MNLGMNSMTSKASWKSVDAVSDQFPAGLRVLVVDDDPTCLRILERMLKSCHYEVTKCSRAELALKYLKDNKDGFDIVISDVHMPDMDGFKLLELIGLDMDLPVIMMSADDSKNVVMKGVEAGACDYLIKPVRMEALKNIWQHVVRKKRHEWKEKDLEQSGSVDDGERQQKPSDDGDYSSSANEGNWKGSRKRKDEEDEGEDKDDSSTLKKQRVVWSTELHKQFVAAVNQLGIDKAVPKKILELMNVPGLTRENVASHLQKYRLYLRRLSGQPQNGLNSFMGPGDPAFVGLDHLQSLRATNKSFVDQRNIFSFESPNMRFLDGQQPLNNGKQMNPLHGIPINSKQFATLHPSVQPYGNVHVGLHTQSGQSNSQFAQMVQPQPRTHMFNEVGNSTTTNLPSSVVQPPFTPYGIENVHTSTYTSLCQPSSVLEFPRSSGFTSKGLLQEELSSEMKGSRSFLPNSDVFNDLSQNRTEDWSLQNVGTTFGTPTQSRVDVVPSVLVQPEFSDLRSRLIRNASINKAAFSAAPTLGNNTSIEQQLASSQGDNSLRVKAERLPEMGFQNNIFADQFGQEDLMTALFKQQEGVVAVENEFGFDEYQLDDLPV